jgi:hypothetical protein
MMSVSFRILPGLGLVHVRYRGNMVIRETIAVFADYMQHPDCRPGQKHLVDLSGVTGFDNDFTAIMEMQAIKAGQFVGQPVETLLAYYAPTRLARRVASFVLRSWEGSDHVVARVLDTEAEALAFLGLTMSRFDQLPQEDDPPRGKHSSL